MQKTGFLIRVIRAIIYLERGAIVGKSYSSREIIKILEEDGWYLVDIEGSHHQFKHPNKIGKTTVKHPTKDIPLGTLKSIERQSGLKF